MSLSKTSEKQAASKSLGVLHMAANLIVLTVNPKLDQAASAEKLNAKAESAKQMFADYRSKK